MESVRKGDIGFFKIDAVPPGYEKTGTKLEILGESGRHVHVVSGVDVFGAIAITERPTPTPQTRDSLEVDQEFGLPIAIIRAFEGNTVIHDVQGDSEQPHAPLKLNPGIYYEVRQARSQKGRTGD